ncbi:MAG: hypothetical protein ABJN51_13820, partial [Sneathiella sp.]
FFCPASKRYLGADFWIKAMSSTGPFSPPFALTEKDQNTLMIRHNTGLEKQRIEYITGARKSKLTK